jgi:hypothetical protein
VLDYRYKVRLRDQGTATETAFRLVTTPPLEVRGKVKRPRLGGWRIEPLAAGRAAPPPAVLLRALSWCYFSGPDPQLVPLAEGVTYGRRWCRLWQVQTPPGVGVYAYLAEVAPHLLALAYLSAAFPEGDVRALEFRLTGVSLGPGTVPAEEGTALLMTLMLRTSAPPGPGGAEEGSLVTEEVH